ncbi:MAG: right-handed parallel beta-helix repeat-containing protein [Cyclobacteriaceae bacterium]|nr:right-handed parallel beta-helix repeat-containing protein [Cyclobacteriaceae bacterium]
MKTINVNLGVFIFLQLALPSCGQVPPFVNTYYIDAINGNDNYGGLSSESAWQSFQNLRNIHLLSGDQILLRGNVIIQGSLALDSVMGTHELPFRISSYGGGRATIESGEAHGIYISNSRYVDISNIKVSGAGRKAGNMGSGIELYNVFDASIDRVQAYGYLWNGVSVKGGGRIRLTHIHAHNNGFSGILVGPDDYNRISQKPVRDIYIGYCLAENNPGCPAVLDNHSGNGILIGGVTKGLIEYSEARNNGWDMPRYGNGPVGIWAYESDSLVIQYCYSHRNKTSALGKDGGGFDFDGGITNSVMQYNLSAFNEGAGYGMYQYQNASLWNNNIIRFNISYHDGIKNGKAGIHVWTDSPAEPIRNLRAYNNTIVTRFGHGVNAETGHYPGFLFENNVFYLTGGAHNFVAGNYTGFRFNRNLFWSEVSERLHSAPSVLKALDPEMYFFNPKLILPENEVFDIPEIDKMHELPFFQSQSDFQLDSAGLMTKPEVNFDFFKNKLSNDKPLMPGAGVQRNIPEIKH